MRVVHACACSSAVVVLLAGQELKLHGQCVSVTALQVQPA